VEFAPPGRRIDLEGRGSIWVREHPDRTGGRPVVLLHGLGATAGLNWMGAFPRFDESLRVVAVDHRGHGRGIRTRRFSLEDCADDVAALISRLGLERPIVVGYSMGGPIATLLWRRHPECVGSLVLCATGTSFAGGVARRMAYEWTDKMAVLPSLAVPFVNTWMGGVLDRLTPHAWRPGRLLRWATKELAGHDPRSIWQAAAAIGEFDSTRWISGIDVPTTVIATARDRLVPLDGQIRMARSIPGAELRQIPAGHLCVAGPGGAHFVNELGAACETCLEPAA